MSERFDASTADARWQARWDAAQSFVADSASPKPKSYVLEMFPYPRADYMGCANYTMATCSPDPPDAGFLSLPRWLGPFGSPPKMRLGKEGTPGVWRLPYRGARAAKRIGFAIDWSANSPLRTDILPLAACSSIARRRVVYPRSEVNWTPVGWK